MGEKRWTLYVCPVPGCDYVTLRPERAEHGFSYPRGPVPGFHLHSRVEPVEVVPASELEEARAALHSYCAVPVCSAGNLPRSHFCARHQNVLTELLAERDEARSLARELAEALEPYCDPDTASPPEELNGYWVRAYNRSRAALDRAREAGLLDAPSPGEDDEGENQR